MDGREGGRAGGQAGRQAGRQIDTLVFTTQMRKITVYHSQYVRTTNLMHIFFPLFYLNYTFLYQPNVLAKRHHIYA